MTSRFQQGSVSIAFSLSVHISGTIPTVLSRYIEHTYINISWTCLSKWNLGNIFTISAYQVHPVCNWSDKLATAEQQNLHPCNEVDYKYINTADIKRMKNNTAKEHWTRDKESLWLSTLSKPNEFGAIEEHGFVSKSNMAQQNVCNQKQKRSFSKIEWSELKIE